jgi:hypothetical protein
LICAAPFDSFYRINSRLGGTNFITRRGVIDKLNQYPFMIVGELHNVTTHARTEMIHD